LLLAGDVEGAILFRFHSIRLRPDKRNFTSGSMDLSFDPSFRRLLAPSSGLLPKKNHTPVGVAH